MKREAWIILYIDSKAGPYGENKSNEIVVLKFDTEADMLDHIQKLLDREIEPAVIDVKKLEFNSYNTPPMVVETLELSYNAAKFKVSKG